MSSKKDEIDALAGFVIQTGIGGREPHDVESDLRELKVSSILLFKRDLVGETGRIARKISAARSLLKQFQNSDLMEPLFAADQEGGNVARIEALASPSAMAYGAAGDIRLTAHSARCVADYLSKLGINWNLAPVLDVVMDPNNPIISTRSFGFDADIVSKHGAAFIKGMNDGGVIACAKHFPGHGRTATDSHLDLPVIDVSLNEMLTNDIQPFVAAIRAGVGSIMIGHMNFPSIQGNSEEPASVSREVVTSLLRERLGYRGLIVTDALEMHAVSDRYGVGEASVRALQAGCDMVMTTEFDQAYEAKNSIIDALSKGNLKISQLRASRQRILKVMRALRGIREGRTKIRYLQPSFEVLEMKARAAFQLSAHKSVYSRSFDNPLAPGERIGVVLFDRRRQIAADPVSERFSDLIPRSGLKVAFTLRFRDLPEGKDETSQAAMAGKFAVQVARMVRDSQCGCAVVRTNESHTSPLQLSFIEHLSRMKVRTVAIGTGSPYEIKELERRTGGHIEYLCSYCQTPESLTAVFDALTGVYTPSGGLPVSAGSF